MDFTGLDLGLTSLLFVRAIDVTVMAFLVKSHDFDLVLALELVTIVGADLSENSLLLTDMTSSCAGGSDTSFSVSYR